MRSLPTRYRQAWVVVTCVLVSACDIRPSADNISSIQGAYKGIVVSPPPPKPDIVLTDVRGEAFNLRERTKDRLLFLMVGYTFCPDVCPLHMANLSAVLSQNLEWEARTTVIFITADPERDTPERLEEWLGSFSSRFVGLSGGAEEIHRIEDALALPRSILPAERDESYSVGHAAQIVAFAPDEARYLIYPFGTRQEDFAHDIPRLLAEIAGNAR